MEEVLKRENQRYKLIIWACCILYTLSCIFKGSYAAALIEVVNSMCITKAQAGYALTAYYITYAIGQILFGRTAKKGNPALKIGVSLLSSAVLLIAFALCKSLPLMIVIWGIHGIAQAIVWPNVIELQSRYLPDELIENSSVIIASGLSFATVGSYVVCSVCVKVYSWELAFYVMAVMAFLSGLYATFFFAKAVQGLKRHKKKGRKLTEEEKTKGAGTSITAKNVRRYVFIMLVFEIFLLVIVSYVRNALTNWLPSMLSEVFAMPSYFSIIMTVVVAVVSLFGSLLVKFLHKYFNNYMKVIAVTSVASFACLLGLSLFYDGNMLLSVGLCSLVVMFTSCMNVVLVSVLPLKMRNVVNAGNFSAIINAFACAAIAFTTTLSGAIIDSNGGGNWEAFYNFGIGMIVVNLLLAIGASVFWNKKMVEVVGDEA